MHAAVSPPLSFWPQLRNIVHTTYWVDQFIHFRFFFSLLVLLHWVPRSLLSFALPFFFSRSASVLFRATPVNVVVLYVKHHWGRDNLTVIHREKKESEENRMNGERNEIIIHNKMDFPDFGNEKEFHRTIFFLHPFRSIFLSDFAHSLHFVESLASLRGRKGRKSCAVMRTRCTDYTTNYEFVLN